MPRSFARSQNHHGQSEKETSSEDEQAQAQKALESEPSQEAYVAEVTPWAASLIVEFQTRRRRDGFFVFRDRDSRPRAIRP
jgi:hypothetical protein